jgi:hypothetical protein
MAFPRGLEVALTDCLLSPCTRFSRARTTPKAPPLIQDITGLGGLPGFAMPGAWTEVHMFRKGSRGAVGGQIYPWLYWTPPESGDGGIVPMTGTPSRLIKTTGLTQQTQPEGRGHTQYRGVELCLHVSRHMPRFLHHSTFGSPPRANPCGQFRPFGFCRPPLQSRRRSRPPSTSGPTRTRMTSLGFRSSDLLPYMSALTSVWSSVS